MILLLIFALSRWMFA